MKPRRRLAVWLFLLLSLLWLLPFSSSAAENTAAQDTAVLPDGDALREVIPEEVRSYFSEELTADTLSSFDFGFFLSYLLDLAAPLWKSTLQNLSLWISILLLCSLPEKAIRSGILSDGCRLLWTLLTAVLFATAIGQQLIEVMTLVTDRFDSLSGFLRGFLPLLEAIFLAGGSSGRAAVSAVSLEAICALLDLCASSLLLPIFRSCVGLYLLSALPGMPVLGTVAELLQKLFLFLMGLFCTVLTAVFSFQTVLAGSADSAASRALKFTAAKAIPVVGGSVSEAMKTMLTSLNLLKSVAGGAAILVILLLTLPLLFRLLFEKLALRIAVYFSKFLEIPSLSPFFEGGSRLYDFLIALLSIGTVSAIVQMGAFLTATLGLAG